MLSQLALSFAPASQNHATMRNRNRNMLKYAVSLPTKLVILWCNYSNIIVDVVKLFFRSPKESAMNHFGGACVFHTKRKSVNFVPFGDSFNFVIAFLLFHGSKYSE